MTGHWGTWLTLGIWAASAALGGARLSAATIIWSGNSTANGNWSTGANWAGTAPGSADIADFTTAGANGWGSSSSPIVVDTPSQALSSAFFDTNAGSYTIGTTGGNGFQLSNAGSIQIRSTIAGTVTETVNAPLVIGTGTGSVGYSFINASTNAATTLAIGGQVGAGTTGLATLTLGGANTGNNVVSGNIVNGSGSLAVLKSGTGTWTLAGTGNTYTSTTLATTTTIADGTLRLGANNGVSSAGGLTIYETTAGTASTFDLNGFNQSLSGTTALVFGATSTTAVAGATYRIIGTGSTLTLNGNVGFTSGSNAATGATIAVDTLDLGAGTRTFTTVTGFSIAVSSVIQNGTLVKTGNGLLTLSGANAYAGGTSLNQGTLAIGNAQALGTGTLTIGTTTALGGIQSADGTSYVLANGVKQSSGVIATYGAAGTGNLTFLGGLTLSNGGSTIIVNNTMTTFSSISDNVGSITLTKQGTGALVIAGNSTSTLFPSATIDIQGGMFAITGTYNGMNNKLDGGVVGLNGTYSGNVGTSTAGNVQWVAGKAGGFAAYGANAAWGSSANNLAVNLGGGTALTWGSTTNFISSGAALILGNASSNGTVTLQNAINLNGAAQTVQADRGASAPTAGVDAVLSGVLSNGSLVKTGNGTLALTAANTYTGGTTVNSGALLVNGSLATGTVSVAASSAVDAVLGGTGTINGAVVVGNGIGSGLSIINAGGAGAIGTLTLAGGLSFGTNGEIAFELNSGATTGNVDVLVVAGTLSLGGTVLFSGSDLGSGSLAAGSVLVLAQTGGISGTFNGYADGSTIVIGSNSYQINYGTLSGYANDLTLTSLAAVPEPSVGLLLLAACGLLVFVRVVRMREAGISA